MYIERVIELLRESKRKAKCPKGFKYSKKLRSCVPIRKKKPPVFARGLMPTGRTRFKKGADLLANLKKNKYT